MRERLIATFVCLTIVIVALYGIPRSYAIAELTVDNERAQVGRAAELVALAVTDRVARGEPVTEEFLDAFIANEEQLEYRSASGELVRVSSGYTDGRSSIQQNIGLPEGATLSLRRSSDLVADRVVAAVSPIILIGFGLIVVSIVAAFVLARRLARPFQQLAEVAEELGAGRLDLEVPHFAVREAEEIASALRASNSALTELRRREQEFSSNVSHQLRTPITALRLQLEDLTLRPETSAEVRDELVRSLNELDRLSSTVSELLDVARGERLSSLEELDLVAVADAAVTRWADDARRSRRRLCRDPHAGYVRSKVPEGPVQQILDVLIENSLRHGEGAIEVFAEDVGSHVEIGVKDEGSRPIGQSIFLRSVRGPGSEGEGIGLAVAKELAEALRGHLRLDDSPVTSFTLMLPHINDVQG